MITLYKKFFMEEARKIAEMEPKNHTVFWFDIDYVELTLVNRIYGREKGNELLRATEEFLAGIKEVSAFVRLCSGRFAFDMITDEPKTDDEIKLMWQSYISDFLDKQRSVYPMCNLRVCCGICMMGSDDYVMDAVDNASFARKESRKIMGHSAVVYTPVLLERLNLRRAKELEVLNALRENRFTYFMQPIVDLQTGRIVSAEALARQITVEGDVISPDSFLPIMEENGSVIELDFAVLKLVCCDIAKRQQSKKPVVRTSINLSRLHVEDAMTAQRIHDIAEGFGIPPRLLNFEITETIPIDEFTEAKRLIDSLRTYGYTVSIDDYGSGYNGITVWQDLDFDVLKMDQRFLSDDTELKEKNTLLIPNTIDIAKKMNVGVVCEGVERLDQCRSLIDWGCRAVQGFYFSKPVPPSEFYGYYEEHNGAYSLEGLQGK